MYHGDGIIFQINYEVYCCGCKSFYQWKLLKGMLFHIWKNIEVCFIWINDVYLTFLHFIEWVYTINVDKIIMY